MMAVPTKCASSVAIVALSSSAKSDLCGTKSYRVMVNSMHILSISRDVPRAVHRLDDRAYPRAAVLPRTHKVQ